MKKDNGITIIALIITIIIMLILVTVTMKFGTGQIERAKLEDLKTTMLLIKGRAQIVIEKESFGEEYDKTGMTKISEATSYILPNFIQEFGEEEKENFYIWEQTAMDNKAIDVTITNTDFYIIDYSSGEIYYSLGYEKDGNTYHSLTDIQGL